MAARKEVAPRISGFEWPADALPNFGWWGFNCERLRSDIGQDVIASARLQLDAHALPLAMAWRDAAGLMGTAKASREKILEEVRRASVDESVDALFNYLESINIFIPFAGTLLRWGWKGSRAFGRRLGEARALHTAIALGEEQAIRQRSAAAELGDVLRSLAHPRLPAIVAVEDMHLMTREMAELVDVVSATEVNRPVLVVGTVWPEGYDNPDYARWLADARRRDAVEEVNVPSLTEGELIEILRWYAPATGDESAHRVVRRLNNPHFLRLWLSLRKTERTIERHANAIVFSEVSPIELPADADEVIDDRWDELPEGTKAALRLAAAVNPLSDPLGMFVPDLVSEVAAEAMEGEIRQVQQDFQRAVEPAGWCRLAESIQYFTEESLTRAARRQVDAEFGSEDLSKLRQVARACLLRRISPLSSARTARADASTILAAGWIVALGVPDMEPSVEHGFAYEAVSRLVARRDNYAEAVRLGKIAASHYSRSLGIGDPRTLTQRAFVAACLGESGRTQEAIEEYHSLIAAQSAVLGISHPDVLASRSMLNTYLEACGRLEEAIDCAQALVRDQEAALGPGDPLTLVVRNNRACWLRRAGRREVALAEFEALVTVAVEHLASHDPVSLAIRENLVTSLLEEGRVEQAEDEMHILLDALESVSANGHAATFATRRRIACIVPRGGEPAAAYTTLRSLLADCQMILGPSHAETIKTHWSLADILSRHGEMDSAIEEALLALDRCTQAPASQREAYFETRNGLAMLLGGYGRSREAVDAFWSLLIDEEELLGKDHRMTLQVRNNLSAALLASGRYDIAIEQFAQLAAIESNSIGPDDPLTLQTRSNLVACR